MEKILQLVKYYNYNWKICCDSAVVSLLIGMKRRYSKYQCYLCIRERRKTQFHYTKYEWERRTSYVNDEYSVINTPLVEEASSVIIPPLHVKLGFIKKFLKFLKK